MKKKIEKAMWQFFSNEPLEMASIKILVIGVAVGLMAIGLIIQVI